VILLLPFFLLRNVDGIKGVTPDSDIHADTTEDIDGPSSDGIKFHVIVVETICFLF